MDSFALLLGHLVGDYVVQNDWMARNKTNPFPPRRIAHWVPDEGGGHINAPDEWFIARNNSLLGHLACTIHCICYTLIIWLFAITWIKWWGLLVCFIVHWPIDRFRLARWWMTSISGQKDFATGPLAPWSIIVVDNTFHLLTLYGIWLLSKHFGL